MAVRKCPICGKYLPVSCNICPRCGSILPQLPADKISRIILRTKKDDYVTTNPIPAQAPTTSPVQASQNSIQQTQAKVPEIPQDSVQPTQNPDQSEQFPMQESEQSWYEPEQPENKSKRNIIILVVILFIIAAVLFFIYNENNAKKAILEKDSTAIVNTKAPTSTNPALVSDATTSDNHEAIDLGLSVKWASCNIGANSPEEPGSLVGWADVSGSTETKNPDDYPNADPPSDISGGEYDIATSLWGNNWRLPTKDELDELNNNCTWQWTTENGTEGMKVTGTNGNSIFLPVGGNREGTERKFPDFGFYWSGTLADGTKAWCISIDASHKSCMSFPANRYIGILVRPVTN